MGLQPTYIDPASIQQLINNLNSAIDDAQLSDTLAEMKSRIQNLESANGSSESSQKLHQEIKLLQIQINYIKDRAAFSKDLS